MAGKAAVVPIAGSERDLKLDSGRAVRVRTAGTDETLEIVEASGAVSLTVRLTPEGPVIEATGARLALRATESIALEARTVAIAADEAVTVDSKGTLTATAAKDTRIHSEEEVRVTGKMIHLN